MDEFKLKIPDGLKEYLRNNKRSSLKIDFYYDNLMMQIAPHIVFVVFKGIDGYGCSVEEYNYYDPSDGLSLEEFWNHLVNSGAIK